MTQSSENSVLKAGVDARIAKLDADIAKTTAMREALVQISKGYDALIAAEMAVDLPGSIVVVLPDADSPAAAMPNRFSNDNMTVRVKRILSERSREYLTARQILDALIADGWTTTSTNKIAVVRNTISDLAKRIPELDKRDLGNGTVGYAWVPVNIANNAGEADDG